MGALFGPAFVGPGGKIAGRHQASRWSATRLCRPSRPRPRATAPGNRRSHRSSSSRNPSPCRRCGSTADTSIGWKDARKNRVAASWCAPAQTANPPMSPRHPTMRAPACTNTVADHGPCTTGRSISPISPTAACIGRCRACPSRDRSRPSRRGAGGSGATPTA